MPASLLFALGVAVGLVGRRRHPHQRALGAAGGVLALLFIAAGGLASCSNGVVGGGDGSGPGPGAGGHDSGARGGDPGGGGDPGAGGGEAGASGGAGGSAGSLADAGPPLTNTNCLEVRTCASGCTDETCIAGCIDRGAPAARVLYEDLRACSKRACPDQTDQTCRCEAECIFGPGACAEIQDMCADGATDITCEKCL